VLGALPLAVFGILPNAILADIAEHDALKTGSHREGIYYGARTFMQKIGQMIAMLIFTSLLVLGRDVGDDLGVRISGVVAAVFCLGGLYLFSRYNEKKLLAETDELKAKME
jgi:glycoside/pentoside/hexuronide:cation symporter, GPH family